MIRDSLRTTIFLDETLHRGLGREATRLLPAGAPAVVIDWSLPSDDTDDSLPPDVVRVLCRALLASGRLAFRCDTPPSDSADGDRYFAEPDPSAFSSVKRFFLQPDIRFGVFATSAEHSAASLFGFGGWTEALQAALVIDPDADEPSEAIARLQSVLDWSDYQFPKHVRALFGSGHDGSFSVLACRDTERLNTMLTDLRRLAAEAAIAIESGPFRTLQSAER